MLTSCADVPLFLPGRDNCRRRSVCHRSETSPTSGRRNLADNAGNYLMTDDAWGGGALNAAANDDDETTRRRRILPVLVVEDDPRRCAVDANFSFDGEAERPACFSPNRRRTCFVHGNQNNNFVSYNEKADRAVGRATMAMTKFSLTKHERFHFP